MRISVGWKALCSPLVCLLLVLTVACGRTVDEYAGKYESQDSESSEKGPVFVELMKDGKGIRRIGEDEATFRWDVRDGDLRVHTKSGGILIGKMHNGILEVDLPEGKKMSFKKID